MDDLPGATLTDEAPARRRRYGRRRWVPIVVAVVAALVPAVAAVVHAATSDPPSRALDAAGGAAAPSTPGAAYGWFAYADPTSPLGTAIGTPVDAVERAGLRLPGHATVDRVETRWDPDAAETYLFVFHVDEATATAFCTQPGLDGARPISALSAALADPLGSPTVTAGSRWCGSSSPTNPDWFRSVLIDAGDPATVHLALQRS